MRALLDLCEGLPQRSYAPGDILLGEGTTTDSLHILVEGEVEICKNDIPIYATGEPGSLFGEMSVLLQIPHTATVRALGPCQAYFVGDATGFLRANQGLGYLLARLLAQRLNAMTSYLADLKAQFHDRSDHLGMVDEVLESLMHHQDDEVLPGSDRYPDVKL
jgi:CRP-like cAMP-binding protein